jgi:ribosomal protein S14
MLKEELIRQYENKSNIELLFIASNYDDGYTDEAIGAAMSLLLSRTGNADLQELWSEELGRLEHLDKKCSLCQREDIAYSEKFYLCGQEKRKMDIAKSLPGLLLFAAIGIGYTQHKISYSYVTLEFKLCSQCFSDRINALDTKSNPKISWEEYYKHPLCKLYMALGFNELRTII